MCCSLLNCPPQHHAFVEREMTTTDQKPNTNDSAQQVAIFVKCIMID